MSRDLCIETIYPHPPAQVWRVLTDPDLLAQWLMPNNFQPVVGQDFQFRMSSKSGWDGVVRCTVLELEPERKLSYSWIGGKMWGATTVTWTLTPVDTGTLLVLEHRGFEGLLPVLLSFMMRSGWGKKLRKTVPAILSGLS